MAISLNDNIRLETGKNLDDRYLNGVAPWANVAAVNTAIVASRRYTGLTVLVAGDEGPEEYWYRDGVANVDLILKQTSSGGGDISVSGTGVWKFQTAITTPIANGKVRFDNATIGSITAMNIAEQTDELVDASGLFGTLAEGDLVYIQQRNDATRWVRLVIDGALTDNGTWWAIPVVVMDSGGSLPDDEAAIIVKFSQSSVVPSPFKGSYATLAALEAAHPAAEAGDYAIVDEAGKDAILYIWDDTDTKWVESGKSSLFLTEYFTGDGTTTVFTIPATGAVKIISVYVGGQRMKEGVHYTKNETAKTVTLTTAIPTGIGIDVEYLTELGNISALPHWDEGTWGLGRIATQAETNAGTDDTKGVTALKLATWWVARKATQPEAETAADADEANRDNNKAITPRSFRWALEACGVTTGGPAGFVSLLEYACSDEASVLTTGLKLTVRAPFAFSLDQVRASLVTAQTSGSILTIDIKVNGTSVFSTLLTIDNTETTSKTAATAAFISNPTIADDAVITFHITQVGDGTATGLKIKLYAQ